MYRSCYSDCQFFFIPNKLNTDTDKTSTYLNNSNNNTKDNSKSTVVDIVFVCFSLSYIYENTRNERVHRLREDHQLLVDWLQQNEKIDSFSFFYELIFYEIAPIYFCQSKKNHSVVNIAQGRNDKISSLPFFCKNVNLNNRHS